MCSILKKELKACPKENFQIARFHVPICSSFRLKSSGQAISPPHGTRPYQLFRAFIFDKLYKYGTLLLSQSMNKFLCRTKNFKCLLTSTFEAYCKMCLCIPKFHLLDHNLKDLSRFGCLGLLGSSTYKHMHSHIKQPYCSFSQRRTFTLKEILSNLDVNTRNGKQKLNKTQMQMKSLVSKKILCVSTTGSFFVTNGTETTVRCA